MADNKAVKQKMDANAVMETLVKASKGNKELESLLAQAGVSKKSEKELITETQTSSTSQKITIPESMSKEEAANELLRQYKEEQSVITVSRHFKNWHWKDTLYAFKQIATETFGWVRGRATFFSTPTEIEIVTDIVDGKKVVETCYYGQITASPWDDAVIVVGVQNNEVYMNTSCMKMHSAAVRDFYKAIEDYLSKNSIYRGKAIVVESSYNQKLDKDVLDFNIVENKPSELIVLNKEEESLVNTFVIDELGEEGKRIHLFTGDYGNGKTETAMRVGAVAESKGMSFFYCKKGSAFTQLLSLGVQYQPCLIFLEDVDEIASGEERDEKMNKILNTVDGVETKNKNVTIIFTTNHPEKITKPMRRPGRIDLVVNFANPELETIQEIFKRYFKDFEGADKLDYKKLSTQVKEGAQGAVIAEISKRALKVARKRGKLADDIVFASIKSLEHQQQLMKEEVKTDKEDVSVLLATALNKIGALATKLDSN